MKPKHDSIIEISGHPYRVKYVKGLTDDDGNHIYGWFKPNTGEILIEDDQPEISKRNTLIHEIGHGIMEHAGFSAIPQNEQVASAFAYGLESVKINGKKWMR